MAFGAAVALAGAPAPARAADDPLGPLAPVTACSPGCRAICRRWLTPTAASTGPNGQLQNPAYLPALVQQSTAGSIRSLRNLAASPPDRR